MMNHVSFTSLLTCLLFISIISTDAFAQKKTKSAKSSTVTSKVSAETPGRAPRAAIDVTGLQSIGAPHTMAALSDTVISHDGKVKVVNTPTGAYFIINQPSKAQADTLNDWFGSAKRSERASEQKRR